MAKCLQILMLSLFLFNKITYSQEKVDKYCEVICAEKGFGAFQITAYIETGKADSLFSFKDSTILGKLNKVKAFKSEVDVLNYMSSIRWALVSARQTTGTCYFIFRRSFDKSEIAAP